MAEELKRDDNPNSSELESAEALSSDELISLEDLVRDAANTPDAPIAESVTEAETSKDPAASGAAQAPAEAASENPSQSAAPASPSTPEGLNPDALDNLLALEDPNFAQQMAELKEQGTPENREVVIDPNDLENLEPKKREDSFFARLKAAVSRPFLVIGSAITAFIHGLFRFREVAVPFLIKFSKSSVAMLKAGSVAAIHGLKATLGAFKKLPLAGKLMVVAVAVLAGLSIAVLKVTFKGRFLPGLQTQFHRSFAEVADEKFDYEPNEPMEDFTDPIHHPEHVVLIDQMVVNLRPTEEGSNPMGILEFFIEASSHEAAVEIKDREAEVRDTSSRAIEQLPYEELVTGEGKNKLKVILRKNLNELLTKGRVRRVFLKTIVLKP